MTMPRTALKEAPQIAIRVFPSGTSFYLDITSTEDFRAEALKFIKLPSREHKHDRFVSHFASMKKDGIQTCSYESRSGTTKRALIDLEVIRNFCKKHNIELITDQFLLSTNED